MKTKNKFFKEHFEDNVVFKVKIECRTGTFSKFAFQLSSQIKLFSLTNSCNLTMVLVICIIV